jgi:hypothetical protein
MKANAMAVARIFDWPWTPDQYDELIKSFGGHTAPGNLLHWAAVTDSGMRAVDCYESRDAADQIGALVAAAAAERGLAAPQITEYEVHTVLTPA